MWVSGCSCGRVGEGLVRVAGCSCDREGGGGNTSPFMVGHEEETSLPHHLLLAEGGNKACQFPHRFIPVGKSCIDLVQHVLLLTSVIMILPSCCATPLTSCLGLLHCKSSTTPSMPPRWVVGVTS